MNDILSMGSVFLGGRRLKEWHLYNMYILKILFILNLHISEMKYHIINIDDTHVCLHYANRK